MIVAIELYGRLRDAGLGNRTEIELPEKATAADALAGLRRKLGANGAWLDGAALASDSEVLAPKAALPCAARLAALPPVCGG